MRNSPDVDILLGVYNQPHLVGPCIESLLENTQYPNWRLIVVDDASDDFTRQMLVDYTSDRRVRVHRNVQNLGFIGSYNRAIQLATAQYVVLLNSDTLVPPGWLRPLVETAEADPQVALVNPASNQSANLSLPMAPGTSFRAMHELLAERPVLEEPADVVTTVGFCLLARRSLLEEHGALDPIFGQGYCEDTDLHMRLVTRGYRAVLNGQSYVYHLGSGSFSSAVAQQRFNRNYALFRQRWGERYDADFQRYQAANPLAPLHARFAVLPPAAPPQSAMAIWGRRMRQIAGRVMRNKRRAVHLALHPREALRRLRQGLLAPPPGEIPAMAPPPLITPSQSYLEHNTRRDCRSVVFVLEGLGLCGGCLRVIGLVNRLTLAGVEARLAVSIPCHPSDPALHGALFAPMCFQGYDDLMRNFPRCDVAVATLWTTVPWVRKLVDTGRAGSGVNYLQDFEAWFYDDPRMQEKVFATYPLLEKRIATSHWLDDLMCQQGYPTEVIPYGFDAREFYPVPRKPSDRLRVIAMARPETPRRGFEILVEALREVHRRRPNVEFVLYGTNSMPQRREVDFPVVDLGIVTDRGKLAQAYNTAEIFIDPSRFQGFGLPALEAMSCGLSSVLTDVGGVHEYARHETNCLLVPPSEPKPLAAAVLRLIDDAALRKRLGKAARRTVEQMRPEDEIQHWIEYTLGDAGRSRILAFPARAREAERRAAVA